MIRVFLLVFGLIAVAQAQELKRYSTLLNRLDLQGWESDPSHCLDERGVHMSDSVYHPVALCQFGLLCLDSFRETGDSTALKKAKDQIKYFYDYLHVDRMFEGKGLGLRYEIEHKGLEPPWYSGMAQGLGISFLLRYYQLTQDETVLPAVRSLKYTMLQPQNLGGCLSMTDENYLWIEEYPNCPASPQVLNGFIFALFGLMDYCVIFKDDLRANQILEECLTSLKSLIPTYDSRTWTRYNKRALYPIREYYLRVQIFQMRQLYEYTLDPFYLRQMCVWSAMDFGKTMSDTVAYHSFDQIQFCAPGSFTTTEITPNEPLKEYKLAERESKLVSAGYVPDFPWYGYAVSNTVNLTESKVLDISVDSTKEVHMLYRYSWDNEIFEMQKWQAANGVSDSNQTFQLRPGTYQFCIFYRMRDPKDGLDIYKFDLKDLN